MEDSDEESGPSKKSKMVDVDQSKPLDELAQYKQLMRDRKKASMVGFPYIFIENIMNKNKCAAIFLAYSIV